MKTQFLLTIFLVVQVFSSLADENPYIAGGVSASDREWNGRDYVAAFRAIQSEKVPLPRLNDKFGKRVIERLTNVENFAFNRNKTLPLDQRLGDYLQLQEGFSSILKIYGTQANQGKNVHAETATVLGFGLRVSALGVELANELLPTFQKDDKYETRMQGLKKMYEGLTLSFVGAEMSLTETKFYSESDLSLILRAMYETLPAFKQAFTSEYKQELARKLSGHRKQFKSVDLRRLENMIKMLQVKQVVEVEISASEKVRQSLNTADKVYVYEGLPHQSFEADLLEKEKKRKDTATVGGFPFYTPKLSVEEKVAKSLKAILGSSKSYRKFSGEKRCGGFHPDYAVAWSEGGNEYAVLICYGCGEALFVDGKTVYRYDCKVITELKKLFAPFKSKRP